MVKNGRSRQGNLKNNARRRGGAKPKSSSKALYIVIAVCALAVICVVIWKILSGPDEYRFVRSDLDEYVELTEKANLLSDGMSVYCDMSGGMNYAYATPESKAILQAVIDKLAGSEGVKFYSLAKGKIDTLTKSHVDLYNHMLDPKNYYQQQAPIEKTLNQIVDKCQPALLMSDFEEYNGSVIHRAAYAKKSFIDWLAKGYNITFYKWDFVENSKKKKMFLAVFDDNAGRLNSLVKSAIELSGSNIDTYVLGGRDFAYPTQTHYPSLKQGGNYHNKNGKDVVTAVVETGHKDAYFSYAKPLATATGAPGAFAPLNCLVGSYAEYYPLGVNWVDAINNAKVMQDPGVKKEDQYTHLLRDLHVDLSAQDGFSINGVEVRVFDMQPTMKAIHDAKGNISLAAIDSIAKEEINMVLTAGMQPSESLPRGWKEIYVDFDDKFTGSFIGGVPSSNLIRANIVISNASPEISKAEKFFGWDGNPSLANSVKETLTADSSHPEGRILYTYYLKVISE